MLGRARVGAEGRVLDAPNPRAPLVPASLASHLQPSGPGARGSGRGAGPQARGALAALPPRPPAAGPQPWARRRRAARGRRASCGQRVPLASALGGEGGFHLQRAEPGRGPGRAPRLLGTHRRPAASPQLASLPVPFPAPQRSSLGSGGLPTGLASSGRGLELLRPPSSLTSWKHPQQTCTK